MGEDYSGLPATVANIFPPSILFEVVRMTLEFHYAGALIVEDGLEQLAPFLSGCSWSVELRRSGYDGTLYLRASNNLISLDMDSGQGPEFVFSGVVSGSEALASRLIGDFSRRLARGEVTHRIELYGEPPGDPLGYFNYQWPQGYAEPVW